MKLFSGCNSTSWFTFINSLSWVPYRVLCCFHKIHFRKINCGCIGILWKILPKFPNTFFLCNLVDYLKEYPGKLLLLSGTVHLTSKLLYFDNYKLMYLLIASFQGYFCYDCYCFHVFGVTIADLDAVSVKDLVEAVFLRKMLIK